MKFWLGVTDNQWFDYQEKHKSDELNFWQPSATPPFKNAPLGMPFLFKLKRPYNHIAGGGFYVTYSTLPLGVAWDVFGQKNGAETFDSLKSILAPFLTKHADQNLIGCTILSNIFFIPRDKWIKTPDSFASNIVRGKMYDTNNYDGNEIWEQVRPYIDQDHKESSGQHLLAEQRLVSEKYGQPYLTKQRLGQGSFRLLVTDAYQRKCAITGENILPVLEAAHIIPYSKSGTHEISNGLLLRSDFHRLFDLGLVTVTPELKIQISPEIHNLWCNGRVYYRLHGADLASVPLNPNHRPNRDYLAWHNKECFIKD